MKIFFTILGFVFVSSLTNAQVTENQVDAIVRTADEATLVMECSSLLQEEYYYFAEKIADKLLTIKPKSSNYNYRKGFIVMSKNQDYITALPFLENAVREISNNYDMYSHRETGSPVDAFYHLAKCYHLNENLDKAEEYYKKFLAESRKSSTLLPNAELGLVQVENARSAMANPKNVKVKNLGNNVNIEYPEYSPVISLDGTALYYTSRRPWENGDSEPYMNKDFNTYTEDIFMSEQDGSGGWSKPKRMEFCGPEINEATVAVSADERKVFAYQDITGGGDLFSSVFADNKFQTLDPLEYKGLNSEDWETHCSISPDGRNIYFVSNRLGGFGGRDIYKIAQLPDGTWTDPVNLGPTVNTAYDEESPFMTIDNKTMYYSSNGPKSIGGFDIFMTVKDEQDWTEPINLGYPINRTGDDLYYTTTVDGYKGYLSSWRPDGFGEKDIYEIQNDFLGAKNAAVLNATIHRIDGPIHPEAFVKLKCVSCKDELEAREQKIYPRLRDGVIISNLDACRKYEITYMENETKEIKKESFSTACAGAYEEIKKDVYYGKYSLVGTVTDKTTGAPIPYATVEILDKKTKEVIETFKTDGDGKYRTKIIENGIYDDEDRILIKMAADGYLAAKEELPFKYGKNPVIEVTSAIDKVEVGNDIGKILNIKPIYFDLDKSNIRPDAQIELDKIVIAMNDNPNLTIELGSHTDCRSSQEYNLKLSNARAISSANYIKKRIKNPKRIYGKGYGETMLVNDCPCEGEEGEEGYVTSECTEEQHQANRRTEFKIIKM